MAQYAQDGGQHGGIWGNFAAWPNNERSLHNLPNNNHPPAILDPNDTALLSNFFQNPDDTTMNDSMGWFGSQSGMKMDGTGFDSQLSAYFSVSDQTVSNPSVTLVEQQTLNSHTHSHQQPDLSMASHMPGFAPGDISQTPAEDVTAASQLFDLYSVSNNPALARTTHMHGATAAAGAGGLGYWVDNGGGGGYAAVGGDHHVRSPLTSSGRESQNSHHSQQQLMPNPLHSSHYQTASLQDQQLAQFFYRQQQAQAQAQSTPRAYHPSLEVDTSRAQFFPQQLRTTQSAHPRGQHMQRPPPVQFGSDDSFNNMRYQPPNGYAPREDVKATNLTNVPFAGLLAADGQSHAHAFTPEGHQHMYQRHSVPNSATGFYGNHTITSPNQLAGLPLTSPLPTGHQQPNPFSQMARRTTEGGDQGNGADKSDDMPSRKRRKSQIQREDDAEYDPKDHVSTAKSKRITKVTRSAHASDDDDAAPQTKTKPTIKRRKSSANSRPSPDSEEFSLESDGGEALIGSRKKRRNSRSNLTDEQKRKNHIRSEKQRRDLIKNQYETLDELVPALKAGKSGLSRADVLEEIVSYVENVVSGNEDMRKKLSDVSAAGFGLGNGGVG